jgi:type I restriction enzyme S subunit
MKKGWTTTKFGDLGRVFNGNSISENDKKAHYAGVEKGVPYIGTKDVGFDSQIQYDSGVKIPPSRQDGFKLAPANSVLVCAEGGSAGRKIAHTDSPIYFGNKLFAICPKPETNSRFVFYYCLSDDFSEAFRGSMAGLIGGVSLNKFKDLEIELPPLSEQQRIVGVLDEAFAGLATAQAHAAQNLQNARALFESHLQSVFTHRGKGWVEKRLGDVLVKTETTDPTRSPNSEFDYIDVSSVSNETLTIQETQRLKGKDAPSRARRLVRAKDVLFATIRPTLRRIAIVPEELDEQVCSTGYFVLRANREVDFRFIFYFLQTEDYMVAMEKLQKGASYPAVTDGDVRSQPIPVPTLAEQHRIVTQLDALAAETQRLTRLYEQKQAALAALKKSLLHQAFTGEL